MHLTAKEQAVVGSLRRWRVCTLKALCEHLDISHMTVVRALKEYGYHTSYNKNSAYYTLKDIPAFDTNGLWAYGDIRFSEHGTLMETILAMVNQSCAGYTVHEIEKQLGTKVGNLLCRLGRQKRLSRYYAGRYAVYLSTDAHQQLKQKAKREQQREKARIASKPVQRLRTELPEGIDAVSVISVLIRMIEMPDASAASLSRSLQSKGTSITAEQIRSIVDFYSLEKKTAL